MNVMVYTPYLLVTALPCSSTNAQVVKPSYKAHPASFSAAPDLSTVSKVKEALNST